MKVLFAFVCLTFAVSSTVRAEHISLHCTRVTTEEHGNTIYRTTDSISYSNGIAGLSLVNGKNIVFVSITEVDTGYYAKLSENHKIIFDRASRTATLKVPLYCSRNDDCEYESRKFRCSWKD